MSARAHRPAIRRAATAGQNTPALQRRQAQPGSSLVQGVRQNSGAFVSDERATIAPANPASVTIADTSPASLSAESTRRDATGIRIRTSDKISASAVEPNRIWPSRAGDPASAAKGLKPRPISPSDGEGSVVRIRDAGDDLQLASAEEASGSGLKLRSVSSKPGPIVVSDLFAPPPAQSETAPAPTHKPATPQKARPAQEKVTSVLSVKPQGVAVKARGRVTGIDLRGNAVHFKFNADQSPAPGTMVKVYHQFLLGEECVGALEVISVKQGIATARPVGALSLNKIAPDDQVAFQTGGTTNVASSGTALFAAP
jgi:hypothetical protein